MKILIAEDDNVSRLVLASTLKKQGHEVVAVENGLKALEAFQKGSGANFIKCMFLSGEKALQILGGQDYGPNFRSGGCFSC
jgi:CheY-like chemotaxis protein